MKDIKIVLICTITLLFSMSYAESSISKKCETSLQSRKFWILNSINSVKATAISASGRLTAVSFKEDTDSGVKSFVSIFDSTGELILKHEISRGEVTKLAFTPDENLIVLADSFLKLRFLDFKSGVIRGTLRFSQEDSEEQTTDLSGKKLDFFNYITFLNPHTVVAMTRKGAVLQGSFSYSPSTKKMEIDFDIHRDALGEKYLNPYLSQQGQIYTSYKDWPAGVRFWSLKNETNESVYLASKNSTELVNQSVSSYSEIDDLIFLGTGKGNVFLKTLDGSKLVDWEVELKPEKKESFPILKTGPTHNADGRYTGIKTENVFVHVAKIIPMINENLVLVVGVDVVKTLSGVERPLSGLRFSIFDFVSQKQLATWRTEKVIKYLSYGVTAEAISIDISLDSSKLIYVKPTVDYLPIENVACVEVYPVREIIRNFLKRPVLSH